MILGSSEVVFFTAAFLVPGFDWSAVLAMRVPARMGSPQIRFLESLTLSCINHGLWSWVLFPVFKTGYLDQHPYLSGLFLFGITYVSPVILGLLSGMLQQKDAVARFLRWLGLRTAHATPRAWDRHFARSEPCWVLVTLKDGSRVYGLFHRRSFAASDPEHRDLFLEAHFHPTDGGQWAPVEDSGGVLIMAEEIAVVEFRRFLEEDHER